MDKNTTKKLMARVEELLAKGLGESHPNVSVRIKGGTYTSSNLTIKVELAEVAANGVVQTREAEHFKVAAKMYGLTPDMLGKTFTLRGKTYEIMGSRPKARKNQILAKDSKGKQWCMPADDVRRAMGVKKDNTVQDEQTIMRQFVNLSCQLSPENLCCDGECSKAETNRRYKSLMAQWRSLEILLGRGITEDEVWTWETKNRKPRNDGWAKSEIDKMFKGVGNV